MASGTSPNDIVETAARDAEDVTWGARRKIIDGDSLMATLPPWAASSMGLDGESNFQPGFTPAGQSVRIDEPAIIIRIPHDDGSDNHE